MKSLENKLLGLSLFALLLLSGCIKISYEAEQTFKSDGSSSLEIDEYANLDTSMMGNMSSLGGSQEPSSILMQAMMDYYNSSSYPSFLCRMMTSSDVEKCTANSDGSVSVDINLKPGDFYSFKSETDWLNLKETKTYKIDEVPMANYYAAESLSAEDMQEELSADLKRYFLSNSERYLTDDAYCSGGYAFDCEFLSFGTTSTVELSKSSGSSQLLWAACSERNSTEFIFLNDTEAKALVSDVVELNRTITSSSPLTVSLECPENPLSIVLAIESIYGSSVETFDIETKASMKQKVLDSLDPSESNIGYGSSTSSTEYEDFVLDFRRSKMMSSDFEELADLASTSTQMMGAADISVEYSASFPDRILSAKVGTEDINHSGGKIELTLDDLEDLPEGSLIVVTEKQLSPLGILTWIIPLLIVFMVIILLLLLLRK
jgi:hypothetical protein